MQYLRYKRSKENIGFTMMGILLLQINVFKNYSVITNVPRILVDNGNLILCSLIFKYFLNYNE